MQDLPNGAGFCYRQNKNGLFESEPMISKATWSYESIHWLCYMETQPPFRTNDRQIRIRHALNGGEVQVSIDGHSYNLDGYAEIDGVKYLLEFDGCRYHSHSCCTSLNSTLNQKDDTQRNTDLGKIGKFIQIFECEWLEMKSNVSYTHSVSKFFGRKDIAEIEILNAVADGSFFGFIRADIKSPQNVIDHFMKVRFPPIFAHVCVEESMLAPAMLEILKRQQVKFPLKQQLSLVFNHKQYILTTELARFYLNKGMEISNVTLAVEYTRSKPLEKFIKTITEKRKQATLTGDTNLQNTWKLVNNSCYGRLSLNLLKRRTHKYVKIQDAPIVDENPFITSVAPVVGEFETGFVEITRKKRRTTDRVPGEYFMKFLKYQV